MDMKTDLGALNVFKALADETRLRIISALAEKEMYAELLAERLGLTAATVSFHMKKLYAAGIVAQRREQYYTVYTLKKDIFSMTVGSIIKGSESKQRSPEQAEEQYRQKVLRAFMPCGVCETLPAQIKKRRIVFEEIISRFEDGKTYSEQEVNEIICAVHADYCTVRRSFIGLGWMERDHGTYIVHRPTGGGQISEDNIN